MPDATTLWIAGTIIGGFGINLRILQLVLAQNIVYPKRWSIGLNLFYTLVSGAFIAYFGNLLWALLPCAISFVFIAIVVMKVGLRDSGGINFGQRNSQTLRAVDELIIMVLFIMQRKGTKEEIRKAIDRSLSVILTYVVRSLSLHPLYDSSKPSIFYAKDGKFKVICEQGIEPHHIGVIEEKMKYGSNWAGIAGKAGTLKEPICMPDLSDRKNIHYYDWVEVYPGEERRGTLISIPLIRGVGRKAENELLAVLNVTSLRRNRFDCETAVNFLLMLKPKIEALIMLGEMNDIY